MTKFSLYSIFNVNYRKIPKKSSSKYKPILHLSLIFGISLVLTKMTILIFKDWLPTSVGLDCLFREWTIIWEKLIALLRFAFTMLSAMSSGYDRYINKVIIIIIIIIMIIINEHWLISQFLSPVLVICVPFFQVVFYDDQINMGMGMKCSSSHTFATHGLGFRGPDTLQSPSPGVRLVRRPNYLVSTQGCSQCPWEKAHLPPLHPLCAASSWAVGLFCLTPGVHGI